MVSADFKLLSCETMPVHGSSQELASEQSCEWSDQLETPIFDDAACVAISDRLQMQLRKLDLILHRVTLLAAQIETNTKKTNK